MHVRILLVGLPEIDHAAGWRQRRCVIDPIILPTAVADRGGASHGRLPIAMRRVGRVALVSGGACCRVEPSRDDRRAKTQRSGKGTGDIVVNPHNGSITHNGMQTLENIEPRRPPRSGISWTR